MATYLIRPGDSLWEIANDHHLTIKELLAANPQIKNPDLIFAGDSIVIPNRGPTAADLAKLLEPLQQLRAGVTNALAAKHKLPAQATAGATSGALSVGHGFGSGSGYSVATKVATPHVPEPGNRVVGVSGMVGSGLGAASGAPPFVGPVPATSSGPLNQGVGHSAGHRIPAPKQVAAKRAATTAKYTQSAAVPWLTLAYGEYLRWQPWLKETNVAARYAWMHQKILQYGAAGGLSSVDEWCSCFVNWVLQNSLTKPSGKGFVGGTRHALAGSWAAWSGGKQVAPRRGAICVKAGWSDSWCDWKHVGFCLSWSGGDAIEEVTEFDQYSNQYIRAYYNISVEMLGGNQGHPNGYDMGWGYSAVTRSWQTSPHGFLFIWPKWLK